MSNIVDIRRLKVKTTGNISDYTGYAELHSVTYTKERSSGNVLLPVAWSNCENERRKWRLSQKAEEPNSI
jgi:hypothetical protein